MKYLSLLLMIFASALQAQDIDSFLDKINYLDKDNQIISYDFIYKSGPVGLTNIRTGHGVVMKKSDDTLGSYHNIVFCSDGAKYRQIYDGKYVNFTPPETSDCILVSVDSFDIGYKLITGNVIGSYRPKFLYTKDYYRNIFKSKRVLHIKIDTVYAFGQDCYKVEIKPQDGDIKNILDFYYFNKHNLLPLGNESFYEYAGTKFYDAFIISNIIATQDTSQNFFNFNLLKTAGYKCYYPEEYSKIIKKEKKDTSSVESTQFSIDDYKGKIVVMDFWYIGCGPCYQLIPVMEKLHDEFPDVVFLGANPMDKEEKVREFAKIRNIKYKVFSAPGINKKYNITAYPQIIIFDKNGDIVKQLDGYSESHYQDIKSILKSLGATGK